MIRFFKRIDSRLRKTLGITVVFLFPFFHGSAQPLSPADYHSNVKSIASPNAASLGKYGNVPVNLFTGTPNISVPLMNISYGGITIPVELSYHGGGITVSEQPGWAGTGWDLVAGGQISRKVNYIQDEFNNLNMNVINNSMVNDKGYFFTGNALDRSDWNATSFMSDWLNSYNSYQISSKWTAYIWDGEPDEFQFSFGGYSGSFYRSEKGEWKVKSKQSIGLEISHEMATGPDDFFRLTAVERDTKYERVASLFTKFTITTPDGYKYIFGGDTAAIEFSRGQLGKYHNNPPPGNPYEFSNPETEDKANYITANSWYLSQIITPLGDTVSLRYKRGKPLFQKHKLYNVGYTNSTLENGATPKLTSSMSIINPAYLQYIETPLQKVEFTTSTAVELGVDPDLFVTDPGMSEYDWYQTIFCNWADMNCVTQLYLSRFNQQLDSIKVYNKLTQQYNTGVRLFQSAVVTQRRTLDSLVTFNFGDNSSAGKYKFAYNDIASLPRYESLKRDHFGFYNAGSDYNVIGTENLPERGTAPSYCTIGLISKITYPTGGETDFQFEAGNYASYVKVDPNNTVNPVQLTAENGYACTRIRRITDRANFNTPPVTRDYFYTRSPSPGQVISSGVLTLKPKYTDRLIYTISWGGPQAECNGQRGAATWGDDNSEVLNLVKGGYVTYSQVKEAKSDGSSIVYKYANSDDPAYRDEIHDNYAAGDANWVSPNVFHIDSQFVFRVSANDLERGNLLSEEYYKAGGIKVKEMNYEYVNDPNRKSEYIKAFAHKEMKTDRFCGGFNVSSVPRGFTYKIYTYKNPLKKVTETNYETSGAISQVMEYRYDIYGNKTQVTTQTSDNQLVQQITKFNSASDYLADTATTTDALGLRKLFTDYKIKNYPVEQLTIKKAAGNQVATEQITGGTLYQYRSDWPVVSKVWALEQDRPFYPVTIGSNQSLVYNFTNSAITNGSFVFDNRYRLQNTVNAYTSSPAGAAPKPIDITTLTGKASYTWDYLTQYMCSRTDGATADEIAFSSFEGVYLASGVIDHNRGYWNFDESKIVSGGFSGAHAIGLGSGDFVRSDASLASGKAYTVSFWVKGSTNPRIKLGSTLLSQSYASLKTAGAWRYYSITITGNGGQVSVVPETGALGDMIVDELRLYPQAARMQSYTYDPATGNVTTVSDASGTTIFYTYDGMGRLETVRDEAGHILKKHSYQLFNQN